MRQVRHLRTLPLPPWPRLGRLGADIIAALSAQRFRWSLWLPAAFATGIGLYFSPYAEPPFWWGFAAAALAVALVWRSRERPEAPAAIVLLAASLGFLAADLRCEGVAAPVVTKRMGVVQLAGRIIHRQAGKTGTRMLIAVDHIDGLARRRTPARVRISWRGAWPGGVEAGDRVRVAAVLTPLPGQVAPGAFDFARYAFFRRIGALGFAVAPPEAIPSSGRPDLEQRVASGLNRIRGGLSARFEAAMPKTAAAVATALLTGERGGIAQSDLDALRDSGLAHLLAISGLHMMLVGGFAFWCLRTLLALSERIALMRPVAKWAALAAIPVAAAYLVVSGAPISAQRAFLMFSLMMVAVLLDRRAISMRTVALAAVVVLALTPESLLEPGFQMSFAAVVALIAVYESRAESTSSFRTDGGWIDRLFDSGWRLLASISITTVIASMATAPFAAFHFQQSALYALPANLAAMPIFMLLVMPFGLLAVMLMPLGLEALPLKVMAWGIDGVLTIAHAVSGWPGAAVEFAAQPLTMLVLLATGGLWVCVWKGPVRWLGAVPALAALTVAIGYRQPDILIDEKGGLLAVRDLKSNDYFLSRTTPRFVAGKWLERDGDSRSVRAAAKAVPPDWQCDALGCVLMRDGRPWLAHVRHARALDEDCGKVSILVSEEPVRGLCEGPSLIIGRFDLWRRGAHAIWLNPDGISVKRVKTTASKRPWSPYRTRLRPVRAGNSSRRRQE